MAIADTFNEDVIKTDGDLYNPLPQPQLQIRLVACL